ncbi:heparinase II/III family protein [Paenibacillus terrigena]|uniref:heparinase II/III domain-containing protein n=1 Tax=Paenibacillus terrigena TaxID=369333 RepID=UPI0028D6750B|nr:heparinase II/III family protein [Paenibacillus terrigena]
MRKRSFRLIAFMVFMMVLVVGMTCRFDRMEGATSHIVKTGSTFYTAEKRKAIMDNIKNYEWAAYEQDVAIRVAAPYRKLTFEQIWNIVTPQSIPRSYDVNEEEGSLMGDLNTPQNDRQNYEIDPINHPWKVKNKMDGHYFPANDFASYYKSGLNEQGIFEIDRADRGLLVNTTMKGQDETFGVDDGYGYVHSNGNKFTFIAYYNHALWSDWIVDALEYLRKAYLYTGDTKYAEYGIVLLDRIADVYPDMDVSKYRWEDGFKNAHGGTGQGKVLGSIAEVSLVKELLLSYDAFYPVLLDDKASYVSFLKKQSYTYKLSVKKDSASDIRSNIENRIVKQVVPAVQKAQISGNFGSHQSVVALAAVVYHHQPETEEWIDFIFRPGKLEKKDGSWQINGGGVYDVLANHIDRDGYGDEASPEYNATWIQQIRQIADMLEDYDSVEGADLYQHPKVKKMFGTFMDFIMQGKYTPTIGDSGSTGQARIYARWEDAWKAFEKYRDPRFAQAAYFLNGNKTEGIHGDITQVQNKNLLKQFVDIIRKQGTYVFKSTNLTGYGFGSLRTKPVEAWMYYGRNGTPHAHRDALNIGLYGYGVDLAPDLGYVTFADENMLRNRWESNTISHNTVVYGDAAQDPQVWTGKPLHFDASPLMKLIDVRAKEAYEGVQEYRRTLALVPVDAEHSYAIDLFHVNGDKERVYSFHGPAGSVGTSELKLVSQHKGTYAGEEIAFADEGYSETHTSGYNYLTQVERDEEPQSTFQVSWTADDEGATGQGSPTRPKLRLTMLGQYEEAALADGVPPQNKEGNPKRLTYLLVKQQPGNHLYTSVLEPYTDTPFIHRVKELPVYVQGKQVADTEARALEITLNNGRVDTLICVLSEAPNVVYELPNGERFQGFYGMISKDKSGKRSFYTHDGHWVTSNSLIDKATSGINDRYTGTIADFSQGWTQDTRLHLKLSGLAKEAVQKLVGQYIYVANDTAWSASKESNRNAVYLVQKIVSHTDQEIIVSVGNSTLIREQSGPQFVYDIVKGQSFYIPMSSVKKSD